MKTSQFLFVVILAMALFCSDCQKDGGSNQPSIPSAPTSLTAVGFSATQINLSWSDNSNNETGFRIERSPNNSSWTEIATVGSNVATYQNTGLTASTTYYYRVKAYNNAGSSAYTSSANATTQTAAATIPNPPSSPSAAAVSSSQINVSWTDNSNNETGFKIERSPNNSTWTEIATVGANVVSYSNTGLSASTTYYYRIRSYNGAGNSAYSSTTSTTTQAPGVTIPNPPLSPAASAVSSSQINVSWTDNSGNETGFKIESSPNNSTWTEIATVGANVVTYSNTGLSASTTYYYRIRSYNGAGNSAYTSVVNATTQSNVTIPNPPLSPAAAAVSSSQINVSWTDNSTNETGFKVERSPNNSTWTEIVVLGANVNSYQNTGLTASTTYYYRIRSYNGAGNSAYTSVVNATTQSNPTPPAAPSGLTVNASSPTNCNLSWIDNSTNETGFEIQRESTSISGVWVTVTTVSANVTSYSHSSLSETWPGYRVKAVNASGSSSFSNTGYAPAKLRVINNLYSTTPSSGNDWHKLNAIGRVRIGPSSSAVTAESNTYERLCPYDMLYDNQFTTYANWITPAYNQTTQYKDFAVSTYGYGSTYYLYLECDWWDYIVVLGPPYYWTKTRTNVLCSNGTCCCYKWAWVQITNHSSGYFVITAKDAGLPWGSWNNTIKGLDVNEGKTFDAKIPVPKY